MPISHQIENVYHSFHVLDQMHSKKSIYLFSLMSSLKVLELIRIPAALRWRVSGYFFFGKNSMYL